MIEQSFVPHWVQRSGVPIAAVYRPESLASALDLLASDPSRIPIAGGTDLILDLARDASQTRVVSSGAELIDLGAIEGFDTISIDGELHTVTLAGRVTHNDVIAHPGLTEVALPLVQACLEVGSPQLRNRATVAGNLLTASPANDTISALVALGASLALSRLEGSEISHRWVHIDQFFTGFRETVREPNELLTAITFPALAPTDRAMFAKVGLRVAQAISVIHVAVVVGFESVSEGDPEVAHARIAIGSAAPTVVLAPDAAKALVGTKLGPSSISAAAEAGVAACSPIGDGRASQRYREYVIATVLTRVLQALAQGRQAEMLPRARPCLRTDQRHEDQVSVIADKTLPAMIDDETEIAVVVNTRPVRASGAVSSTLLDWLRDNAGTGTKEGCAEGECGACTVHIDGQAVMSCLVLAAQADGADVLTIEGLSCPDGSLHPVQQCFVERFAVQCGFCTPGFIMASAALVQELDIPDTEAIEFGLAGNLCRCTGYYPIVDALKGAIEAEQTRTRNPVPATKDDDC